jgi:hypothetical protein
MTVAEAIDNINTIRDDIYAEDGYGHETQEYADGLESLDMAIRSLEAWEKVKAEITEYGNLCVVYIIKGNTEKDIEDIVASVLSQEKSQILHIINEHLKGVTK